SATLDHQFPLVLSSRAMDRRDFLATTALGTASLMWPRLATSQTSRDSEYAPIWAEIEKRHDEAIQRLQQWIRQPSIAAENRGLNEGCHLTMQMLRDAGFQQVTKIPSEGQPGIFATLDAGAPKTLGLYFMYDVKQADPSEWSSPPWEARLVDKPGLGKVIVGRGAVNQKRTGSHISGGAACHSRRRAQAACKSCAGRGGRRRDRVATLSADCAPARGHGPTAPMRWHFHAYGLAGTRRKRDDHAGSEGRGRMRSGVQR